MDDSLEGCPMRSIRLFVLVSMAALACFAATAGATSCYIILDRSDNVVYRDTTPPVDLSDRGSAERAALRQRGDFLLMIDADQCARFVATTGRAGSGGATVDEIVAGLRGVSGVGPGLMSTSGSGRAGTAAGTSGGASGGASMRPASGRSGY
jgi:hypothetical protein